MTWREALNAGGEPRAAWLPHSPRAHSHCVGRALRYAQSESLSDLFAPALYGGSCTAPGKRRIASSSAARAVRLTPARYRAGGTLRYAEVESLSYCLAPDPLQRSALGGRPITDRALLGCPHPSRDSFGGASSPARSAGGESHGDRPAPATTTRVTP